MIIYTTRKVGDIMLSLFIDTHSPYLILALMEQDKLLNYKEIKEKLDSSTICMPTLINLLKESNRQIKDVKKIIVVNGPGSFTGERLGVTIAKTLAYTLNIPITTMTSLETYLSSIKITSPIYLALEEKNGYFLAQFNEKKECISDYFYLNKEEYNQFKQDKNIELVKSYDILQAIKFGSQKKAINCHLVKPLYVKKIEVEK